MSRPLGHINIIAVFSDSGKRTFNIIFFITISHNGNFMLTGYSIQEQLLLQQCHKSYATKEKKVEMTVKGALMTCVQSRQCRSTSEIAIFSVLPSTSTKTKDEMARPTLTLQLFKPRNRLFTDQLQR